MNKTIWAIAFVVLACGVSFAMDNASVVAGAQSEFTNQPADAGKVITEGGNVTEVTLSANVSTEKWAGFYGNVSGMLVLAQAADQYYLYNWTMNKSKGSVCVSTNTAPAWAGVLASLASTIDTAWGFTAGDTDSAANTFNQTAVLNIGGTTVPAVPAAKTGGVGFLTGVVGNLTTTGKDALAFCVNTTDAGTNYKGGKSDFELMAPTNETEAVTETYYFFVELG